MNNNKTKKIKAIKVSTPENKRYTDNKARIVSVKVSGKKPMQTFQKESGSLEIQCERANLNDDRKRDVIAYIEYSGHPLSKGQILKHFPDLEISELSIILSDKRIIDLKGQYCVIEYFNYSDSEKMILKELLDNCLSGFDRLHINTIFEQISNTNSTLLQDKNIRTSYVLFSLLEKLFYKEFQFIRPYVSKYQNKDNDAKCDHDEIPVDEDSESLTDQSDEVFSERFHLVKLEEAKSNIDIRDLQAEYLKQYELGTIKPICNFSVLKNEKVEQKLKNGVFAEQSFKGRYFIPYEKQECEELFGFYKIADSNFSVRTRNALLNAGIQDLPALGEQTPSSIANVRNLGTKSVREVTDFFKTSCKINDGLMLDLDWLKVNRDYIFKGDFDACFASSEKQVEMLSEIKKAYDLLGDQLVKQINLNKTYGITLSNSLFEIPKAVRIKDSISSAIAQLPEYRISNHASNYIAWFNLVFPFQKIELDRKYMSICLSQLEEFNDPNYSSEVLKMLEQLRRPLIERFVAQVEITVSQKVKDIYYLRSSGLTLEEVGTKRKVTRERIRQLEQKAQRVANKWFDRNKIFELLFAECNGSALLERKMLNGFSASEERDRDLFWYALRQYTKKEHASRYKEDYIILEDFDFNRLDEYVDSLPDIFEEKVLVDNPQFDKNEKEYIKARIVRFYDYKNGLYGKKHLTIGAKFDYILRNYYPSGIKIYDSKEIDGFVEKVWKHFDYNYTSQHAVESGIAKVAVLCDRGKYVAAGSRLPKQIVNSIIKWIDQQDNSTILIQSIFIQFKKELSELGVSNKYQLQGKLKAENLNGATVWREYVLKRDSNESIYDSVRKYVSGFNYPVSKAQIKKTFPGITDIVIAYALEGTGVINYFGEYVNADKLDLSKNDLDYLETALATALSNNQMVHIADLYESVRADNEVLLKKLGIFRSFGLFSLLQYFFPERAEYNRPFIAPVGQKVVPSSEQIKQYVEEHELLLVDELLWKAGTLHYAIQDIRKLLESFFATHILLNKKTLASISLLGIDEYAYLQTEKDIVQGNKLFSLDLFLSETNKTYLEDADEWFMYSVTKKWGNKLQASVSGQFYSETIPHVTIKDSGEEVYWDGRTDLDNPDMLEKLYEEMMALEMEYGNELF